MCNSVNTLRSFHRNKYDLFRFQRYMLPRITCLTPILFIESEGRMRSFVPAILCSCCGAFWGSAMVKIAELGSGDLLTQRSLENQIHCIQQE